MFPAPLMLSGAALEAGVALGCAVPCAGAGSVPAQGILASPSHQHRGAEGSTEIEFLDMEQLECLDLEKELWFGCAGGVVWGQAQHPLKE